MNSLQLKEVQNILGKNQQEIADLLEISKSAYQKYVYGEREIPRKIEIKAQKLLSKNNSSEKTVFGLNDAIKLIFDNLKEAEKTPFMQMYKETIEQRAIMEERERIYQKMLKSKQQNETQG
ncbi:hypothetical protein [Aquimarina spongiae]|uniref:Helix-turn-helix n=1 Tax=Aquimarina spongiae TaxID=570521 RepID=A0A1M6KZM7_9FLAO|nr:hypothetical protein [Aquimarina spongiae]SHJ64443.1 hypothetical protein SAMN04488508_11334 [Aquimarina spongiae]